MAEYRLLVQETLIVLCLLLSSALAASSLDSSPSNRSCIADERDALLSVKASLLDPNDYLSSWQGEDCCSWKGVRCSEKTGHVVKLNLRRSTDDCQNIKYYAASNLGGEISYSLVNLQHLRYLDLSCNSLIGEQIPEFLASLTSLRYLNLSYTLLHGRVPPQIGNLTKLMYLDLKCWYWYNPVNHYPFSNDLAWLSRLSSLKHLDISYVNLSTSVNWLHKINMLPTLKELKLINTGLRNTVPSFHQFNLTALEVLDISENYFHTTIAPNWFWNATNLTYLNIRSCCFYGPIPNEIGKITSLQQVLFGDNNLMAMIPPSFRNLCNLKTLDLEWTNTTGDIAELMERLPNCHWNKLQALDLSLNNIGGEIPDQPGPLANLTYLLVSDNKLTGKIPSWIWALRNLYALDLSENRIGATVNEDHLNNLTELKFLGLGNTLVQMEIRPNWIPPFKLRAALLQSLHLGPAFPSWLESQPSIVVLVISNASITAIPDWFWVVFSRAKHLHLADNQISGALPATLEFMVAEIMVLSNNRLNGTLIKFPRKIVRIDISKNSLSGTLPLDFGAPWLQILMLYNNSISGIIPPSVCSLEYLQILDLSTNMLAGEVPNCQKDMKFLNVVNLNTNNLSGEFPSIFKSCPKAIFVDLSYNQFYGNLPVWIWEKVPFIALLRLRSNMFHGHIPSELAMSKELQFLDLAYNNLSGSIPHSLVNLSAMSRISGYSKFIDRIADNFVSVILYNSRYESIYLGEQIPVSTKGQQLEFSSQLSRMVFLDFSCNNLTGAIPQDIGALIALKAFNLSWNRLRGQIPANIGKLKQLESLDLSHNELSGEIPSSMTALTSLSRMNLSYNNLSGKIPTGNQFGTWDASVYIGNVGLCGPPLTGNCGNSSSQETHGNHRDLEDISLYLAMIIGFVLNLWVVFCVMLFKKSWRIAYFVFLDELYDKIYVSVVVRCAILKRKFGIS